MIFRQFFQIKLNCNSLKFFFKISRAIAQIETQAIEFMLETVKKVNLGDTKNDMRKLSNWYQTMESLIVRFLRS
jgi:hypothetical protein